jgi:hypothetical protein
VQPTPNETTPPPSVEQHANDAATPATGADGSRPAGTPLPPNRIGVAAMAVGCAGAATSWTVVGWPLDVLAICLGAIGMRRATRGLSRGDRAATAGLTLGIGALVLVAAYVIIWFVLAQAAVDEFNGR